MALFAHGCTAVTSTPSQPIPTSPKRAAKGVRLKAAAGNGQTVFVGNSASVNGTAGDPNCGYPLAAGQELPIDFNGATEPANETSIYCFAPSGTQYVHWIVR